MYNYVRLEPEQCDFIPVLPKDQIKSGEKVFIQIGELQMVIFNIAGQFYAIDDRCSHDEGPLGEGELEGYDVICPRHGARFDVRSGKALSLPAVVDISAYPVRIQGEMLEVGVPRKR